MARCGDLLGVQQAHAGLDTVNMCEGSRVALGRKGQRELAGARRQLCVVGLWLELGAALCEGAAAAGARRVGSYAGLSRSH